MKFREVEEIYKAIDRNRSKNRDENTGGNRERNERGSRRRNMPHPLYPSINQAETGAYLKELAKQNGYSVKDIQKLLHLSCPQPVYRWFKGQMLPSVDHLFVLSRLFGVAMEDLLFPAGAPHMFHIRKGAGCKAAGWKMMEWINTGRESMEWRCISRKDTEWRCHIWRIGEARHLVVYFLAARAGTA